MSRSTDRRGGGGVSARRRLAPTRVNTLMTDPEFTAFANAFRKIKDPQKRRFVSYLVRELARESQAKD